MKTLKLFTLLFLTFSCGNAYTGSRLYKIELLIFSQNSASSEVFDQTYSKIVWPKNVADRARYKEVSPQLMNLRGSHNNLSKSNNYQPVMHVGWIQSVNSNRLGTAVKISNASGTLNGFFRIQRGNLAYIIADIEYSPGSVTYRLNEKRRFKLNETHYLDHPKFGILARISPI